MNLFSSLFKYIPREGVSPTENFITEAFAYILKHDNQLLRDFLKKFLPDLKIKEDEVFSVQTQYVQQGIGILDIYIKSSDNAIVFENKIDSGFGETQISRYKNFISRVDQDGRVVLLTKYSLDCEEGEEPDIIILWSQIYVFLNNCRYNIEVTRFLCYEFMNFLKEGDMGLEEISWQIIEGLRAKKNLLRMVRTSVDNLKIEGFSISKKRAPDSSSENYDCLSYNYEGKYFNIVLVYDKAKLLFDVRRTHLTSELKKKVIEGETIWHTSPPISIFDLKAQHFLGLEAEQQYKKIYDWIKDTLKLLATGKS